MSFVLKLRDVIVGRCDLAERDAARRTARGRFRPGLGWPLVEPIFALRSATEGGDSEELRARYRRARDTLSLSLYGPGGSLVDTSRIEIIPNTGTPAALVLEVTIVDPAFWAD